MQWKHAVFAAALMTATGVPAATAQNFDPGATRLIGRVLDEKSGKPVASATVRVQRWADGVVVGVAETDENGNFVFNSLPAELLKLTLERIGYGTRTDSVRPQAAHTLELRVQLTARAVELAPIAVNVRSRWLELNGFYQRRQDGIKAYVIDRAMIEKRMTPMLTDLLDQAPGLEIVFLEAGRRTVRINRHLPMPPEAGKPRKYAFDPRTGLDMKGCEPDLYIDGRLHRENSTDLSKVDDYNVVPTLAVEAVEVYVGNGPPGYHHNCGVILIWTRRGGSASGT